MTDDKAIPMQIRTVQRDGRVWLQQYRQIGRPWEYGWVDVCEVPRPPVTVRPFRPKDPGLDR
ncbi:MAG TPA: hypothetical protein VF322_11175 [Gammaproteobacteria bacterium]